MSSGTPLARAFVEIRPDTSRVKPETEAALDRIDGKPAGDKAGREFVVKFDSTITAGLKGVAADVKVIADSTKAMAEMRAVKLEMDKLDRSKVEINIQTDKSRQAIEELDKALKGLDGNGGGGGGSGGGSGGAGAGQGGFGGLIAGALILGPALIPVTGAAIALAAGLAGMGAAGILAFQGIKKEMAAGTPIGNQYTAGISVLKRDLATLEATAAKGVLTGFNRAVVQANALMPDLNRQVGSLSRVLGDVGANALTGLIGGFKTFEPLIQHTALAIDGMSQKFAAWASGPGGAHFGATLGADLDKVLPVLTNLIGAVGKLVAAFAPVGNYMIGIIGSLAAAINAIPVPVLQALAIAFSSLYTAAKLKGIFDGLAASFTKMGVEAAASGSGIKTVGASLGALASHAGNIAAYAAAAYEASQSIGAWLYRNNSLTQVLDHQKDAVANITQAFRASNGAVDQGVISSVQYQIEQGKLTDKLGNMGIGLNELRTAITGTGAELPLLEAKLKSLGASDNTIMAVKQLSEQYWAAKQAAAALAQSNADLLRMQPDQWRALATTADSAKTLGDTMHLTAAQVYNYAGILGITKDQIDSGAIAGGKLADAVKNVAGAYNTASQSGSAFLTSLDAFSKSAGTAADRGQLIGSILKAGNGDALAYAGSMAATTTANLNLTKSFQSEAANIQQLRDQIHAGGLSTAQMAAAQAQLKDALGNSELAAINLKTGVIDFNKAGAGPLIQNLQSIQDAATAAASATYQHEAALGHVTTAAQSAATVFKTETYDGLIKDAGALGITAGQAKKLADKYFAMPKSVTTAVLTAGEKKVVDVLNSIGRQLSFLTHQPWVADVDAKTAAANAKLAAFHKAIDGLPKSMGFTVKAATAGAYGSVNDLLQYIERQQPQVVVRAVTQPGQPAVGGHNSATGNIFKSYANGGMEKHLPQIAAVTPGRVRVWAEPETGGEAYIPLANDFRRPRAQAIAAQTVKLLGGVAAFANGGGTASSGGSDTSEMADAIRQLASAVYARRQIVMPDGRVLANVVDEQGKIRKAYR
jgi:hypothetical protein